MCSVIYSDLGNDQWAYNGEQSSWQRKTIDNWITVLDFFWLLLLHSNICSLLTLTNWHPVTPCVPGECDACFLIHLMMRTRSQAAKKPPLPPSPSVVHWPWQTLGERERRERRERSATHPTHLSDSLTRRIIDSGLTTGLSIWLTCEYQSPSLTFPKTYFILL